MPKQQKKPTKKNIQNSSSSDEGRFQNSKQINVPTKANALLCLAVFLVGTSLAFWCTIKTFRYINNSEQLKSIKFFLFFSKKKLLIIFLFNNT